MGPDMSVEEFLLFALAVIYWVISFRDSPGATRARRKQEHASIDRARRQGQRDFRT
jgi:hypothetical protein